MSNSPIKIIFVDAFPVVGKGMKTLLESERDLAVVESEDYNETIPLCHHYLPDVLILGVVNPDSSTFDLILKLRQEFPQIKPLIFAADCNELCLEQAIEAGIKGYVLKKEKPHRLIEAIRTVAQDETWFSQPVVNTLLQTSSENTLPQLTKQQIAVLQLVAEGHINNHIAQTLGISERTVRYHLGEAYRRLEVNNRTEAALKAHELGLI